jgi:hypothetical protein
MAGVNGWLRGVLLALVYVTCSTCLSPRSSFADPARTTSHDACSVPVVDGPDVVLAGRPYLPLAYAALDRDRARYAGLGPLSHSPILQAIAERHSAYMAAIGNWSDTDPAGWILDRVRAAGLDATYAGQNVVAGRGATVESALAFGEAFFAHEAGTDGPHWANITNPNHAYVGMGAAVSGSDGNYTVYLTQVFSDAGTCGAAASDTFTPAGDISPALRVGSIIHPTVDVLYLRSEPYGRVLQNLHAGDRLKVVALLNDWAQVQVLRNGMYGWVSTLFVSGN